MLDLPDKDRKIAIKTLSERKHKQEEKNGRHGTELYGALRSPA